jgi:hypothetical protein
MFETEVVKENETRLTSNAPSRNIAVFEIIKQGRMMGILTLLSVCGIRNKASCTTELRKAKYLHPTRHVHINTERKEL